MISQQPSVRAPLVPTSSVDLILLAVVMCDIWSVFLSRWVNRHLCPTVTQEEMKTEGTDGGEEKVCRREGEAEGILGVGQPRGVMGGAGAGCSSRAASNYIQGVKPSITPRLACPSSCYSCKRCATLRGTHSLSDKVRARGHKSSALIKAGF